MERFLCHYVCSFVLTSLLAAQNSVWHEQQFDVQSLQCQQNLVFYSKVNDNKIFENLRRRWDSKRGVWKGRAGSIKAWVTYSSSNICITLEQTWDKTLTLEVKSKFPAAILKFDLLGEKQPRGTEIETGAGNRIQSPMVASNLLFLWSAILVRNNTLTTNNPQAS